MKEVQQTKQWMRKWREIYQQPDCLDASKEKEEKFMEEFSKILGSQDPLAFKTIKKKWEETRKKEAEEAEAGK